MKSLILILASLVMASPALAQSATGATGSQAATAGANNTVNVVALAQSPPASTDSTVHYSGHEYSTPAVGGSYFGGTNPCLVGTGGGASGGPIGFSLNVGRSDEGCTRRSDAAAWHAMGFDNIAVARMCQDSKNADAFFASTGLACPGSELGRYKMADGSIAPVMRLVSDAKSLPQAQRVGVDLNDPAVQRAIQQQAQILAQQMVQHR